MCKTFPMIETVGPLRRRIAKNLRHLLASRAEASPDIAKAAGVDPKTLNNLVNARFDPRITQVEKVANTFGLQAWQLLATDFSSGVIDAREVVRLLEMYGRASPEGRSAIMQVATLATAAT